MNYNFSIANDTLNGIVALDSLEKDIRESNIIVALDYIGSVEDQMTIYFKANLSIDEVATLTSIVNNHDGIPIKSPTVIEGAVKVEETAPFAKPDYRTKRDGSPTWTELAESATANSDYQLTEERYVSGGECIIIGAKKGDWISAQVVDANSLIPAPYRAAMCEAWPVVAEYVIRANLVPFEGAKEYILNTYPLNAKITSGLVLRIVYHSSAEVGTRSFCSNYYLTKKI